jgi:hypothetical protein
MFPFDDLIKSSNSDIGLTAVFNDSIDYGWVNSLSISYMSDKVKTWRMVM